MKLWKSITGYVNISIVGEYPEKTLNRCIGAGIPIKRAVRSAEGACISVPASDLKRIRYLVRGSGCRVRILGKTGFARIRRDIRANCTFICSLLAFAAAAAFLSSRIWFVRVVSASVPAERVLSKLEEAGIRPGAARRSADLVGAARAVNADPSAEGAKVTLKGVVLNVEVFDSGPSAPERGGIEAPLICAEKDCVITYVSVTSGEAKVKPGDAVKKGEVLISGDLSHLKEGYAVPANGVIMGEVLYCARATAPRERSELVPSGRETELVIPELFGKRLFIRYPYDDYELARLSSDTLTGSPLPIRITRWLCRELTQGAVEDSEEGAAERARLMAQEKLKQLLPTDAKLKTLRTECIKGPDGSVTAVITATTIERIGIYQWNP